MASTMSTKRHCSPRWILMHPQQSLHPFSFEPITALRFPPRPVDSDWPFGRLHGCSTPSVWPLCPTVASAIPVRVMVRMSILLTMKVPLIANQQSRHRSVSRLPRCRHKPRHTSHWKMSRTENFCESFWNWRCRRLSPLRLSNVLRSLLGFRTIIVKSLAMRPDLVFGPMPSLTEVSSA